MSSSNIAPAKKQTFSVAISTESYQNLIRNTLKDPKRANRFIASITSAVATTPALQTCEPSSILAGGLLGEALNLSPSPQLGQYYLVPFKQKAKYDKIQNGQIADKDMWKYSSFWYKDFDSMAKKTLLRQLISKWGIMSTEMQQALADDSGIPAVDPRTGEIITDHSDELELTTDAPQPTVEGSAPAQLQENASEPEQIDLSSL